MTELWKLFFALGEPHRLEMVDRLAKQGPLSMVKLTEGMPISRQAGAKHLRVLSDVGLVSLIRTGREKRVSLESKNVHLGQMFMRQMEQGWDDRLGMLADHLSALDDREPEN